MKFDDWMLIKDKRYVPTDDSLYLRLLRECWFHRDAEIESMRQQLAAVQAENNRLDAGWKSANQAKLESDLLRQQLADSQKQVTLLRDALHHLWNERTPDSLDEAGEALAATADLKDVILCHAKETAWVSPLRYGSQVTFYKPVEPEELGDGFDWYCYPLYRAWEPKK